MCKHTAVPITRDPARPVRRVHVRRVRLAWVASDVPLPETLLLNGARVRVAAMQAGWLARIHGLHVGSAMIRW